MTSVDESELASDAEWQALLSSLEEDYISRRLSVQQLADVDRFALARRQSSVREQYLGSLASSRSSVDWRRGSTTRGDDGNEADAMDRLALIAEAENEEGEEGEEEEGGGGVVGDDASLCAGSGLAASLSSATGRWQFPSKPNIEQFEFLEALGRGAYAEVCVAQYQPTGELFAVKMMNKRHLVQHHKADAAKLERDIMLECDHPHITRLHGTFQDAGNIFMVMELAPHGDLAHAVHGHSLPAPAMRLYLAEQCDALSYLHEHGICHRDVKPNNIFLNQFWRTMLGDFGCAQRLDPGRPVSSEFVGSPEYLPPELLDGPKEAGFPADAWALGCVAYQMLAGQPPFRGDSEFLTFRAIQAHRFAAPLARSRVRSHLDADASRDPWPGLEQFPAVSRDLIGRLLEVDPARRLTMAQMKEHPFFAVDCKDLLDGSTGQSMAATCNISGAENAGSGTWWASHLAPLEGQAMPALHEDTGGDDEDNDDSDDQYCVPSALIASDGGVAGGSSVPGEGSSRESLLRDQQSSVWSRFLLRGEDELIVFSGLVDLKRKAAVLEPMRRRQLILTDYPRLFYVDVKRMQVAGAIPWKGRAMRVMKAAPFFEVGVPGEMFRIMPRTCSIDQWINKIQDLI